MVGELKFHMPLGGSPKKKILRAHGSFCESAPKYQNLSLLKTSNLILHVINATIDTAKSLQSCPTLCDPIPGILQVSTLEWVAISFSDA